MIILFSSKVFPSYTVRGQILQLPTSYRHRFPHVALKAPKLPNMNLESREPLNDEII